MKAKLHFLITSERGRIRHLTVRKQWIPAMACVIMALLLVSVVGWRAAVENVTLQARNSAFKSELASVKKKHSRMLAKVADREEKQRARLDNAMDELRQRSEVIESILATVGIDLEIDEEGSNTGGPYIALAGDSYSDLTFKVDHYLDFLKSIPLGSPVPGTLTSPFGRRRDPFTGRPAVHDGLDIHNRSGTKAKAPAAGTVVTSNYTRANGNYVKIDHGNGFETRYLHLQRRLVNAGDRIERGDEFALLGNTGRSTGPHLHYSILYKDKAIDPYRFVRVAEVIGGSVTDGGGSVHGEKVQ